MKAVLVLREASESLEEQWTTLWSGVLRDVSQ
jgi:hypothetical protein